MDSMKEKYTCDACRYTFESDKLPVRCPDCYPRTIVIQENFIKYTIKHRLLPIIIE